MNKLPIPQSRSSLLASLEGQTLEIPNMRAMFERWPASTNPSLQSLEAEVESFLSKFLREGRRLRAMRKVNAALFGASWFPYASFETLKVATLLSIWLFIWDDENDSSDFSSLVHDYQAAAAFRADTRSFIRQCLYPQEDGCRGFTATNPIIVGFQEVGDAIRQSYDRDHIKIFYDELMFFIDMTDVEHRLSSSDAIPSIEEYQKRRMGSGACGVLLAITEYCYNMQLPSDVLAHPLLKDLWYHTNTTICVANDILSFKKEFATGQIDTLIPYLYGHLGALQLAVDVAVRALHQSIAMVDILSEKLIRHLSDRPEIAVDVQNFVNGCKFACTANINWSLSSDRYRLGRPTPEGSYIVTLKTNPSRSED